MTIWGPTEDVGGAIWLIGECIAAFSPWTIEPWLAGGTMLNLGVPAAEPTDDTIRRQIDSGNIGRILCAASRVSNLASTTYFFGSVTNLHYPGAKGF